MNNKKIAQLKLLYGIFAGILLVCVALFVGNVVTTEEDPQVGGLATPQLPIRFQHHRPSCRLTCPRHGTTY